MVMGQVKKRKVARGVNGGKQNQQLPSKNKKNRGRGYDLKFLNPLLSLEGCKVPI